MSDSFGRSDLGETSPLSPPIYPSSVYCVPDLDALDAIIEQREPGFTYARDSHPNAQLLARELATAEGATWAVVCGSGMAAITAALLSTVTYGDRIVASNRLYGRTSQLLDPEFQRFGVRAERVDMGDLQAVERITAGAKLLLVETISNPLLRVVDVAALASIAHQHGALLLVDNTFATPVLCRPLEIGADIVVESLTKMISGHSDITLGLVCGKSDLFTRFSSVVTTWGLSASPFDCWLGSRSLATINLRMRAACENARRLAGWFTDRPGIKQVIYPGNAHHPDHDVAARQFANRFGNMLCIDLLGGRASVNRLFRTARGIPFSPSLGHTTTTSSHPASTSHRYVSTEERDLQGITDGLVRVSVGIEELDYIQAEFAKGLAAAAS